MTGILVEGNWACGIHISWILTRSMKKKVKVVMWLTWVVTRHYGCYFLVLDLWMWSKFVYKAMSLPSVVALFIFEQWALDSFPKCMCIPHCNTSYRVYLFCGFIHIVVFPLIGFPHQKYWCYVCLWCVVDLCFHVYLSDIRLSSICIGFGDNWFTP